MAATGGAAPTGAPEPRFDVLVEVRLKEGIADPQGATIERSLPALGFGGIDHVTVGKAIRFSIAAGSETDARRRVAELCDRFLANPVIEDTSVTISAASAEAEAVPSAVSAEAVASATGDRR